ncbi:MAG: exodeoxyribonuclease VII large subunit [Cytophagales bacterium]|nr:exodeoxyribonuclease VII large subunit [Bernardetiaceae bacterium]MDW8211500.1 exodeoxyribonuclease VII large subunit [Cytophagales bacterium]
MQEKFFTLLQLNKSIRYVLESLQREIWITAEIAQVQIREHAYLELVQKDNDKVVAKARAVIWSEVLRQLQQQHKDTLNAILAAGGAIRCRVVVNFHEVYGLSLHIYAVDAYYALGEMERQRLQVVKRLQESGLLYRQQSLALPKVIQKIAVVSSQVAAGLEDFCNQLENNPWGYRFCITIFPASVQGEDAIPELVGQINRVNNKFDVLVIIRGGGARLDLEAFNAESVAIAIANCPIPVLTGIGHHRDQTIADQVAHLSLKTPTAVAEFILQRNLHFESQLTELVNHILLSSKGKVNEQEVLLNHLKYLLSQLLHQKISQQRMHHQRLQLEILAKAKELIQTCWHKLEMHEQFFALSHPDRLLARGYYLIKHQGKYLKAEELESRMQVEITSLKSVFRAVIEEKIHFP